MKLRMKTSSQWIRFGQSAVGLVKEVTVRSKNPEKIGEVGGPAVGAAR
jgi:hypothetical protein